MPLETQDRSIRTLSAQRMSDAHVTLTFVSELPTDAVTRVPQENLRVPPGEFGALWIEAERLGQRSSTGDDFLVGVILTCRWLADQPVWSEIIHRAEMPSAPLTGRRHAAMPETIESELLVAYSSTGINRQRADGVAATLEWAWRGCGRPPLDVGEPIAD